MGKPKTKRRVVAPRLDDFVAACLGSMKSYSETVDHARAEFGCSERTVCESISRVKKQWMAAEGKSVEERRAELRADIRHAVKKAIEAEDYRAVAQMFKVRADIEGVKSVKVEHGGMVGLRPVAAMSPQERQREIEVLLAKRNAALAGGQPVLPETTVAMESPPSDAIDAEAFELAPDVRPVKSKAKRKQQVH